VSRQGCWICGASRRWGSPSLCWMCQYCLREAKCVTWFGGIALSYSPVVMAAQIVLVGGTTAVSVIVEHRWSMFPVNAAVLAYTLRIAEWHSVIRQELRRLTESL